MAGRALLIGLGVLLGIYTMMAGAVFLGSNDILTRTDLEPWRIAWFTLSLCALLFACGMAVINGTGK